MSLEQNTEDLSLLEVNQELASLSDEDARNLSLYDAYTITEEEQKTVEELPDSNNEFLKYSQKSESTFVKNDEKLPGILSNIDKLYGEKGIDSSYKKMFAQLIFDESGYNRSKYAKRKNVVGFLQMTKDKFTDNSDIKDGNLAFSQYKNGTRSVENIANDTASQIKRMVIKLSERNIPVTFGGLKLYQYSGGYGKLDAKVSDVARNNIKEENKPDDDGMGIHKGLGLPTNEKPTWREAIAAYDRRAKKNLN